MSPTMVLKHKIFHDSTILMRSPDLVGIPSAQCLLRTL